MSVASRIAAAAAALDYAGRLTDTCTISRVSEGAQSEYGTTAKTWSDLAASVACRYDDPPAFMVGRDIPVGNELVTVVGSLYFLVGQDVTQRDRITTLDRSGTAILSGPIDVLWVSVPAGELHHKLAYLGYTGTA